jgi:hypothetical protein
MEMRLHACMLKLEHAPSALLKHAPNAIWSILQAEYNKRSPKYQPRIEVALMKVMRPCWACKLWLRHAYRVGWALCGRTSMQ